MRNAIPDTGQWPRGTRYQPAADLSASPSAFASSGVISTTSRPPPSSGTRMTMPRPRGGRAPVASLVRLLAPLGIAAPAVRTAVSRMVRQGWLHPMRLATGPGYLLTPKAARRLDEAAARIYRTNRVPWDGTFDLI